MNVDHVSLLFYWIHLSALEVFWWNFWSLLYIGSCHQQTDILNSSFPICISIISFSCLTVLAIEFLELCWIKVVRERISLSCSWFSMKSFQVFSIQYDVLWVYHVRLCNAEVSSFYPLVFPSLLTWMVDIFLSKAISVSIEMILWFLFFSLLKRWTIFIDLHMLKQPYIPVMKPIRSWYIILMCFWMWFANVLLKIFASMFISDIDL